METAAGKKSQESQKAYAKTYERMMNDPQIRKALEVLQKQEDFKKSPIKVKSKKKRRAAAKQARSSRKANR